MTGFRWLSALAVGLTCATAPAMAATFDVQAARKTCLDLYNAEKESGTIPAGMPKSKYVNQCTNSMRRSAELDKELAAQSAPAGGSNEIAAAALGKPGAAQPPTNKPASVTTPAFAQPKGH